MSKDDLPIFISPYRNLSALPSLQLPRHAVEAGEGAAFAYYNFCRIHGSLRVTPAMEAEITDHVWDLRELIAA